MESSFFLRPLVTADTEENLSGIDIGIFRSLEEIEKVASRYRKE